MKQSGPAQLGSFSVSRRHSHLLAVAGVWELSLLALVVEAVGGMVLVQVVGSPKRKL